MASEVPAPDAPIAKAHWAAADAPGDVGLAGLREHLERLLTRHELRSLTVVVDDPDLGRQAFRAGAGAIPVGLTASGPGVLAEPAAPGHAIGAELFDTDLLLALCAANLRVDVLRGTDAATGELALRRLPGVYAVAVERDDGLLLVRVHVADDAPDDLGRVAARELTPEPDVRLVVEIVRGEPAPGQSGSSTSPSSGALTSDAPRDAGPRSDERPGPKLLAVRSVPEDGEIEVHVSVAGARAVGRAPLARGLAGAVEAVLAGIEQVAPGLRWVPAWARTLETTADGHFVVAIALVDPSGHDQRDAVGTGRHGIATGTSPIEAAARATSIALD